MSKKFRHQIVFFLAQQHEAFPPSYFRGSCSTTAKTYHHDTSSRSKKRKTSYFDMHVKAPHIRSWFGYSLPCSIKWTQVALMLLSRSVADSVLVLSLQAGPRGSSGPIGRGDQSSTSWSSPILLQSGSGERATCSTHSKGGWLLLLTALTPQPTTLASVMRVSTLRASSSCATSRGTMHLVSKWCSFPLGVRQEKQSFGSDVRNTRDIWLLCRV